MKKIAIITPFLANGGLEKVAVVEATALSKYYDVTLVVMDTFHIDYPYSGKMIDLQVALMSRGPFKRLFNIFMATWKIRRLKKQYTFDLVISHGELANLPNVFSGGHNSIVVVHENRFAALKDMQGKLVNRLIKYIYSARSVLKVVTVSEGIRESFIKRLGIQEDKIMTIYNPYDVDEIQKMANEHMDTFEPLFKHPVLTTTGRLSTQKGQWFLLRIFKTLKKKLPELKLVILGNGEMKEKLVKLSKDLGLKTYVHNLENSFDDSSDVYFLGFQHNPFTFIHASKLFAMTSLWEGFGNTIVESMACGTPVVSTNCQSGPGEIIAPSLRKDSVLKAASFEGNGVLMPTFKNVYVDANEPLDKQEQLWVETLQQLFEDTTSLEHYANLGAQRAEDFRLEMIMEEWKVLIDSTIEKSESTLR